MAPMKKPWKILCVSTLPNVGGTEVLAAELARAFPENEIQYQIGCANPSRRLLRFFRQQGIDAFRMGDSTAQIASAIRKRTPDLVESCALTSEVAEAAERAHVPFLWKAVVAPDYFTSWPWWHARFKKIRRSAARIAVISKRLLPQLDGVPASRLRVLSAGVDLTRFKPAEIARKRLSFRRAFRLSPQTPAIGMAAHFVPRKRHSDFILAALKVLKEAPQSRFFLFGDAYRGAPSTALYRRQIHRLIQHLGLGPSVALHPAFPDRVALAAGLDLAVLPSADEGISMALLDAMAAGTPVIGGNSGGTPDLIEHGRTGTLVEPKRPLDLAEAILVLLKNPRLRRAFGKAGQLKAAREFDIRLRVREHQSLYAELLT